MERYLKDSFDTLYRESETAPKMMSVGLHCRIIGRPGRIAGLERFIEYASGFDGVRFTTREQIARSWRDAPSAERPVTLVPGDEALAGLRGDQAFSRLLIERDQVPATGSTIGLSHVPPGEATEMIRHTTEEVCLVVRGTGTLRTDLGDVEFITGDAMHIPAGRWHSVATSGDIPVEMAFSFPGPTRPPTDPSLTSERSD
jgi:mannose-6-phosphate isomerase-like protein (cupin superfamily)